MVALGALVGSHVAEQRGGNWRLRVRRGEVAPVLYEFRLLRLVCSWRVLTATVLVTEALIPQVRSLDVLAEHIANRLLNVEAPCPLSPR